MRVILVCALVAACGGGGEGDAKKKKKKKRPSVDDIAEIASDMCACRDATCAKRVRADARDLERDLGDDLDAADRNELRRHRKKLDLCYDHLDDACQRLRTALCDGDKDCEKRFDRESTGGWTLSDDDRRAACKVMLEDKSQLAQYRRMMTSEDKAIRMADEFKAYVDNYCACVDKKDDAVACAKAVTDKYNQDNAPKANEKMEPQEMAAFARETDAAAKKLNACNQKLAEAATGSP